jgi:hypothetical protein
MSEQKHRTVRIGPSAAAERSWDSMDTDGVITCERRGGFYYLTGTAEQLRREACDYMWKATDRGFDLSERERGACRRAARSIYKQLGLELPPGWAPRKRRSPRRPRNPKAAHDKRVAKLTGKDLDMHIKYCRFCQGTRS